MIIEIYNNCHFNAKFSFNHEIEPNLGKIDKGNTLRIYENFIFVIDWKPVEILRLHRK